MSGDAETGSGAGGGPKNTEHCCCKENEIAAQFHGGFYCPMEFAGDPTEID